MPAAQAAKPVLLQYTTLLEFYDDYPTRNTTTATTSHGNPITSPVPSINSTDPHLLPRHILQDQQMCQAIITRGQDYLASLAAPPGNIPYLHLATQMLLRASLTGDGSLNTDLFVNISAYVRQFVEIADRLSPGDVQSVPCEETHCEGVERTRSIRKLTRDGVDRVIVKMQSVAAFNHHASEIQAMAGANNRDGTDIVLEAVETGARSTIYKIGMHMIERSCPWGVLLGGDEFMLFHLDTRISGNDTYHHLVVSDRHAAFPAVADPHMLSLIQVLIALVLGDKLAIQYTSRHVEIRTRYATSERPDKLTESRPCEGTADSKAIGQGPTNATAGPSAGSVRGRRRRETGLQTFDLESLLDGVDLCSVSYPNSGAPTREIAFARVNAQKAKEIVYRSTADLPRSDPYFLGPNPLVWQAKKPGQILAFEEIGSGICGRVYDTRVIVDGKVGHCVAKVIHPENSEEFEECQMSEFLPFWSEVEDYERLKGERFIPEFYGAFAAMWFEGQIGVILMERLDKTFSSYEEMDAEEKRGAIDCVKKLHLAGFHHGDERAPNFGKRGAEMVIFDFSAAAPIPEDMSCNQFDPDRCHAVRGFSRTLYGEEDY